MTGCKPTAATSTPPIIERGVIHPGRVGVAYSGGRDSTALLHATLAAKSADDGVSVLALHVHHGLSPNADAWLAHCAAQCERWSKNGWLVEFHWHRLTSCPAASESVEAWARQARYQALRMMALEYGVSTVLLAHHQRDQAETLLLQALRGAGVAGLASMPRSIERAGITWQRPWLDRPWSEIEAYVRLHQLEHIVDDSNIDIRFARNRLRLQVWPSLIDAFAQADAALAYAASWAQEAASALSELAEMDLRQTADAQGLKLLPWLQLSPARRSNVLRAWLKLQLGQAASVKLVVRLLQELPESSSARWQTPTGELRVHRQVLRHHIGLETSEAGVPRETQLNVTRAGVYRLPGWGGQLHVQSAQEGGVPLAWLARLELRERAGAEQFQAGIGRPPRSLKKQFQSAGVAAWERGGPLVYSGGLIVFVPGLGLDARVVGMPGQPLVSLEWQPLEAG